MQLTLSHIGYTYPGASAPALDDVSAVFPKGWTGIIGDNGCGKTTLALVAAHLLQPDAGSVQPRLVTAFCRQDSTETPPNLVDLATDWGPEARASRNLLRIDDDWFWRYDNLSGGQQKRIQIACALFMRPDVLVLDEPTNDLDGETRVAVADALASFNGIGLLISHDRGLLDRLAAQCLAFECGRYVMRPGGYTKAAEQADADRASALREQAKARRETARLAAEAMRRREEAARQKGKRSRSGLDKKDSDGRARIGLAIVTGKDGVAGKLSATMAHRLARAQEGLDGLKVAKRYEHRMEGYGEAAKADSVAHLDAGELQAGDFRIRVPELWLAPTDHVALTGKNGTGKSLVVRHLVASVPESIKAVYVPQEVSERERTAALASLRDCDAASRGGILSVVARLNSDPERLLDGSDVSPGELRKLALAQGLLRQPNLVVLDEPTNHLDLGSIEALQDMLAGFPGAVLVVTHDSALAAAVGTTSWSTAEDEEGWKMVVGR